MSQDELIHAARQRKVTPDDRGMVDVPFMVLVILLVAIGLLMMFSASYVRATYESGKPLFYFIRQAGFAAVGLVAMFAASHLNCHVWQKLAKILYGVSIVLLIAVLFVGVSAGGAKRWVSIAGQQFQPSEVAKFSLICILAAMVAQYKENMALFRYGVLRTGGAVLVILVLVALEKHLSAIMIIGMVSLVMMYVGGTKKRWIFTAIGLVVVFFILYVTTMGYAGDRITAWLHPEEHAMDEGYQVIQSQYAIGSGGLFGLGFGMGRQKYLYLPFEYNDYIFAIVCEELGFIGALGIMILFALLVIRGYWISMHAADRFSTMLGVGITTLLAVQVILNIGVVCNLLPSTGVGLPFFSYGGTNLMMNLGEMGIILSISRWSSSTRG
ncbi:MAG: putative lipid II flippase FtsW [Faecousia sp.]